MSLWTACRLGLHGPACRGERSEPPALGPIPEGKVKNHALDSVLPALKLAWESTCPACPHYSFPNEADRDPSHEKDLEVLFKLHRKVECDACSAESCSGEVLSAYIDGVGASMLGTSGTE